MPWKSFQCWKVVGLFSRIYLGLFLFKFARVPQHLTRSLRLAPHLSTIREINVIHQPYSSWPKFESFLFVSINILAISSEFFRFQLFWCKTYYSESKEEDFHMIDINFTGPLLCYRLYLSARGGIIRGRLYITWSILPIILIPSPPLCYPSLSGHWPPRDNLINVRPSPLRLEWRKYYVHSFFHIIYMHFINALTYFP